MEIKPTDGQVCVDDEKSESRSEMKNLDCEEEREGKRENEKKCGSVTTVERYNKDKPPEDDCCPICFDDFQFPCRTSCGHWFCASCILQLWRYSTNILCKCPICGCLITNLVPHSSVLIQQGGEVAKILTNIQQYNLLSTDGWSALFMKTIKVTLLVSIRLQERLDPMVITFLSMAVIGLLLSFLYIIFDLDLYPYGMIFATILIFGNFGLMIYTIWILHGRRWIRVIRQRLRHLAGAFLGL